MSTEASFTNLSVVRETDETRPCRFYIRSGSRNIFGSVSDDPETVAFMHLIAAAPQMLEALEYVAMIAHEGGLIGLSEADAIIAIRKLSARWWNLSISKSESIEALNNAIAKAKGGQP